MRKVHSGNSSLKFPRIAVIGYASDAGGTVRGSSAGPSNLRSLNLLDAIRNLGYEVADFGDVEHEAPENVTFSEAEQGIAQLQKVYSLCSQLSSLSNKAILQGYFPLILGGDHSLSIGSVAGISNALPDQKIGLIWVDTHPDINTPGTSPSGCAFGMSTAFLSGRIEGALANLSQRCPAVESRNLAFIGLRDVDQGEKNYLRSSEASCFSIKDVDQRGIYEIVQEAIAVASQGTAGFVVSFDLDVCDPRIVPGTGTPYRGGLTFREAHLLAETLFESGGMLGFELVELNPSLDKGHSTAQLAISLIESALGDTIL